LTTTIQHDISFFHFLFPFRIISIYAFPESIYLFKLYWTATK